MNSIQNRFFGWPLVIITVALPTVVTLIYFVLLANAPAAIQQAAYAIGKAVQFGLPVVCVWWWQRERLKLSRDSFGQFWRASGQDWLLGIGFGCSVVAAMLTVWFSWLADSELATSVLAEVNAKVTGMNLNSPMKFLALGVFYSLVHSFLEEYYWRWFVFERLTHLTSLVRANLISSFGFAAHHVILLATFFGWSSPLTWLLSLGVAIGGVIWAWLYRRSGTLVVPWLSHLIVDAGIFGLGYWMVFGLA